MTDRRLKAEIVAELARVTEAHIALQAAMRTGIGANLRLLKHLHLKKSTWLGGEHVYYCTECDRRYPCKTTKYVYEALGEEVPV